MSIAQRFVAGEGESHPEDSAALAAFRCDSVNLPWVIFRAAFRASQVEELPQRARSVFAALARTVDASRPYASIYAGRALLTDRALQSKRTLYRALADLEHAGLIRRPGQLRIVTEGYEGRFGRAYLHLTETAAALLGLVDAPVATPETSERPAVDAQTPADQSFDEPSATVAHGAYIRDLSPMVFQKRQPGHVPADLQRLLPLGFSKFLVFGLMRQAREAGKRLSDVVEATWKHLKEADRPICYLRALLRSPVDFGHQIRSRDADRAAKADAAAERAAATELVREHAGSTFVDAAGTHRLVLDTDGTSATVYHVDEGVPRVEAGDWQMRFARALRCGRIRVATDADLASFAQARRQHAMPTKAPVDVPRVMTSAISNQLAVLRATLRGSRAGASV
ncbi:Replication protein O [Paraburkholderia sp. EG286B]|uniref:Replication protein O n=1 Tax=Paraburkholderia sp. EG286B TaxID=3237011 RepID=UPI0034D1F423